MKISIVLLHFLLVSVAWSQHSNEWKFLRTSLFGAEKYYTFYGRMKIHSEKGARHCSVWLKLITPKKVDSVSQAASDSIVDLIAEKIVTGKIPPDTSRQFMAQKRLEVIANELSTRANIMMHLELDCADRTLRTISITIYDNDGIRVLAHSESPSKWEDAIPESFGDAVLEQMCRSK